MLEPATRDSPATAPSFRTRSGADPYVLMCATNTVPMRGAVGVVMTSSRPARSPVGADIPQVVVIKPAATSP